MSKIIFVVTGADIIPNITPILRRERYIEYMLCLHKIFNYGFPVYGVLSEYDGENINDMPPFKKFPFKKIIYIDHGTLPSFKKSQCEMISINALLDNLNSDEIDDDTFIIKISGRYLLLDDSFINAVKSNIDTTVQTVVKHNDSNHIFTFLYALRYRYFKSYYESYSQSDMSTENSIFFYLKSNNILDRCINLKRLGILTNVCNENTFEIV
jgi:hypothetical protein